MRFTILTKFAIVFLIGFIFVVYLSSVAVKDFADVHTFLSAETGRLQADVTQESTQMLEQNAKEDIKERAEWAASQIHEYLMEHPFSSYSEMEKDETLQYIAIRKVGKTGYTTVHDLKGINHFDANPAFVGTDLHALAEMLPDFWKIIEKSLTEDSEGFYKWQEADGTIRDKYMYCKHHEDHGLAVCATTYMDEFSMPMNTITEAIAKSSEKTQENILVKQEESYVRFFIFIVTMLLLVTFSLVYVTYTLNPLIKLEKAARQITKGNLHVKIREFNSHDEIGELNGSFIAMEKKLRQTTENLEETVKTRTGELEKKKIALENNEKALYSMMKDVNSTNKQLIEAEKQLKHNIRELKELDREKDAFVSITSHELKTPITVIKGFVNMLQKTDIIESPKKRLLYTGIIEKEMDRLAKLINDILDISRIDLKTMKFFFEKVDIAQVARNIAEEFKPDMKKAGIEISKDLQPNLPMIETDKARLSQIFFNLISNAMHYTPKGGKITVKAERTDGCIHFSIADTGEGIPKNKIKNLFHRFYQVDSSTTRKIQGSGLGLAVTKGIVEQMGGTISVESKEGKGTTAHFTLPLRAAKAAQMLIKK